MRIPQAEKNLDVDLPKVGQLGYVVNSIEDNLGKFSTLFGISNWYKPKYAQKKFHIAEEGEGLHHMGFYTSKFDRLGRQFRDADIPSVLTGDFKTEGGGAVRFEYFDTRDIFGTTIEVIDVTLYGIRVPQNDFMMKIAALTGDVDRI